MYGAPQIKPALNVQVMCINKTDRSSPHDRIQNIGGVRTDGVRWKLTVPDAIAEIKAGKYRFFTSVQGKGVWIVIAKNEGREYLKTEADGLHPNNLLALPECP
jgi:hypothetical protein